MISKIRGYTLSIITLLTLLAPTLVPAGVYAVTGCSGDTANNVAQGANLSSTTGTVSCGSTDVGSNSITHLARKVVDIFSIFVGAVSVIMIIYGGFRYITSGGASERVGNAKNTLIYAVIGLVVVALAQLIVHFVLNQANNVNTGS